MRSTFAFCMISGIAFGIANTSALARDFDALLQGEYMVTGFGSCITAPPGATFNATTLAAPPGSTVNTFTFQGTRTFNGDGTGVDSGISVAVNEPNPPGFAGSAGSSSNSGVFTYTVEPDMTIAIYQAPFDATNLAGNVIGTTFAIADLPLFKGRISEDLRTIIFQHDMPGIETITGPFANLGIVTRQRICTRERTATKIRRGSA